MSDEKIATKNEIIDYWKKSLIQMNKHHSDITMENSPSLEQVLRKLGSKHFKNRCFACGRVQPARWIHRAHITPKRLGGCNQASNLHNLCYECHLDSESLHGDAYWSWFTSRTETDSHNTECLRQFGKPQDQITHADIDAFLVRNNIPLERVPREYCDAA